MGATVCGAVESADDMELAARIDPALGTDLADSVNGLDVVVDFSTPGTALSCDCGEGGGPAGGVRWG